jgi:hypothetical protein
MDARLLRCAVLAAALGSLGASHRTKNFIVSAPSDELAREIGQSAENFRRDLAVEWLGREMPNWAQPCPITAQVAENLGAGGATSFVFDHGEVFGWRMTIQGSRERILDSVLPHEVTHTIFATHFRQPLPRWADEGACTTVEHASERAKQQNMLISFLRTGRGIAFSQMFTMKEYPHDVLPLYSQGYSLARYLVAHGGKHKFLEFVADGLRDENWTRAVSAHYGVESLAALQTQWLDWVRKGSPHINVGGEQPALVAVRGPAPQQRPAPSDALADNRAHPRPGADRSLASAPQPGSDGPSIYERAASSPSALQVAASGPPSDRWHRPRGVTLPEGAPAESAANQLAANEAESISQQVTRPQPVEGPRQVILEWSKPQPAAQNAQAASGANAYVPGGN